MADPKLESVRLMCQDKKDVVGRELYFSLIMERYCGKIIVFIFNFLLIFLIDSFLKRVLDLHWKHSTECFSYILHLTSPLKKNILLLWHIALSNEKNISSLLLTEVSTLFRFSLFSLMSFVAVSVSHVGYYITFSHLTFLDSS